MAFKKRSPTGKTPQERVHDDSDWKLHEREIPASRKSEGTLAEILGLNEVSKEGMRSENWEQLRQNIKSSPSFVRYYKLLIFDRSNNENLATLARSLTRIQFIRDRILRMLKLRPGEMHTAEEAVLEIIKQKPEELQEVYIALVAMLEDGKPSKTVYTELIHAYVEILRTCERSANTGSILSRFLKAELAAESFLEGRDVVRILKDVPEINLVFKVDGEYLDRLKHEGIARGEYEAYKQLIAGQDAQRNAFHNEIIEYAKGLGITKLGVMSDIVFNLHNMTTACLSSAIKEISLPAAVLLLQSFLHYNAPEITYDIPEGMSKRERDFREEQRRIAQEVFDTRNEGYSTGQYESHLKEGNTEDQDLELLEKVKTDNPDLQITYGFEPSHFAHGMFVYWLSLTISLEEVFSAKNPEVRMEQLVKYLNATIGSRFGF